MTVKNNTVHIHKVTSSECCTFWSGAVLKNNLDKFHIAHLFISIKIVLSTDFLITEQKTIYSIRQLQHKVLFYAIRLSAFCSVYGTCKVLVMGASAIDHRSARQQEEMNSRPLHPADTVFTIWSLLVRESTRTSLIYTVWTWNGADAHSVYRFPPSSFPCRWFLWFLLLSSRIPFPDTWSYFASDEQSIIVRQMYALLLLGNPTQLGFEEIYLAFIYLSFAINHKTYQMIWLSYEEFCSVLKAFKFGSIFAN